MKAFVTFLCILASAIVAVFLISWSLGSWFFKDMDCKSKPFTYYNLSKTDPFDRYIDREFCFSSDVYLVNHIVHYAPEPRSKNWRMLDSVDSLEAAHNHRGINKHFKYEISKLDKGARFRFKQFGYQEQAGCTAHWYSTTISLMLDGELTEIWDRSYFYNEYGRERADSAVLDASFFKECVAE